MKRFKDNAILDTRTWCCFCLQQIIPWGTALYKWYEITIYTVSFMNMLLTHDNNKDKTWILLEYDRYKPIISPLPLISTIIFKHQAADTIFIEIMPEKEVKEGFFSRSDELSYNCDLVM